MNTRSLAPDRHLALVSVSLRASWGGKLYSMMPKGRSLPNWASIAFSSMALAFFSTVLKYASFC